jgi:hypothetical protein
MRQTGEITAMSLDLKVIGAGMGRTGTTSLKAALETLLGGPCFHFLEYRSHPELMAPWLSLIRAMPLRSDPDRFEDIPTSQWEKVMPGYVACVDEPASYYWKQLSDAFPAALVILSVRDTDSWWASMAALEEHYEEEMRRPDLITAERREFHDFVDAIYPDWQEGLSEDRERAFFESHNRRVLEHAARHPSFNERFLLWRPQEGWEPLCRALDLPVPDVAFPHENKRSEYHGY